MIVCTAKNDARRPVKTIGGDTAALLVGKKAWRGNPGRLHPAESRFFPNARLKRQQVVPAQDGMRFNVVLDMHSEITCDENYNYHYTNNVENVHLFSPRGLHVKTCTALSPRSTQRE